MVRLVRHTPQEVRRVRHTRHQLSGGVGGSSSVPREVTSKNERFATISCHVHLQQAYKPRLSLNSEFRM